MTTTWDSANKGAGITLSNSDLTATKSTGFSWQSVRTTTSKSSGKYYYSLGSIAGDFTNGLIVGVSNSSLNVNSYSGSDSNSSGMQIANSNDYGFSSVNSRPTFTTGYNLVVAIDVDNKKMWIRANGSWGSGNDPSTNTGGDTWSWSGAVFGTWSGYGSNDTDTTTLDTTTTVSDSSLSGFTTWDQPFQVLVNTVISPVLSSILVNVINDVVFNTSLTDILLSTIVHINLTDAELDSVIPPITSNVSTQVIVSASGLDNNIDDITSISNLEHLHLLPVLDVTIDPIILIGTIEHPPTFVILNQVISSITSVGILTNPINAALNYTLQFIPYLHIIPTPVPVASFDPFHDPFWVAVEFDLFDADDAAITIRLGNRGVITRTVSGTKYQYLPRLNNIPINLGTTITVTSYGNPVRGQPNGGLISFAIDDTIYDWFHYRWNGHVFRVYYGQSTDPVKTDVDLDMSLIYAGRIASFKHDTLIGTVETTDETLQWDDPLVDDFYDSSYPVAIRGKPKPQLWGYAFSIEPQIEDEATQKYAVSHRSGGLDFINEVRVGGIPWNLNVVGPPIQGEWTPDLANGTFTLGSPPLGMDVRCDAQQTKLTLAKFIRVIIEDAGGEVDEASMGALDVAQPGDIGYATGTSPVNRLEALDDVVKSSGCWWSVGPLGKVVAGTISVPASQASMLLDNTNIKSIELNTIQPPAWRIRVGYQRNSSPETSFATSVLQTQQARWKKEGQTYEPHYENNTIKNTLEPRAVDVPQLFGTFVDQSVAHIVQQRLVGSWGSVRTLFDVETFIPPGDIVLYDTVAVDYMMVTGMFRVTGAIRAIGYGPAKLQLWGILGNITVQNPPLLPQGIVDMGIWVRTSGSGTFVVGTDCPSNVTRLWIRGVGGGGGGACSLEDSGFIYSGGGGGAGGYFEDVIIVTASTILDWIIGEGGAGGAADVFGQADDGFSTTFGDAVASGGAGGFCLVDGVSGGGGGGNTGVATVTVVGGPGNTGYVRDSSLSLLLFPASGGASTFGSGGTPSSSLGAPGSGGGAGGADSGIGVGAGKDGNAGMVIVIWFQ